VALAVAADEHLMEHFSGDSTEAIVTSGLSVAHNELLPVCDETIFLNLYSVNDSVSARVHVDRNTIDDTNDAE
jgi:hypothetical protein